jgi:hypothetical protein
MFHQGRGGNADKVKKTCGEMTNMRTAATAAVAQAAIWCELT